jgi:hypothetical protein
MINHEKREQLIKTATWIKNKFNKIPGQLLENQVIAVKMADGTIGYSDIPANYYWFKDTAYPIIEYAILTDS